MKMNLADHQFETYTMISVTLLKYPCVVGAWVKLLQHSMHILLYFFIKKEKQGITNTTINS